MTVPDGWAEIEVTVLFPKTMVVALQEVAKDDPHFIGRVLLYGLTRRSIYHYLQEREKDEVPNDGD